jgi:hypothetical protein
LEGAVRTIVILLALASSLQPSLAAAQESKSAPLAAELARLLDDSKLDSIAAQRDGDQFVGALYFPGAQLLVISGKYAAPQRLLDLIKSKNYKDVYMDLSSASDQATRVFIMDLGANGLRFKREDNQLDTADVGKQSLLFDGDWDRAKMSEAEYRKIYTAVDEQYAEMLRALIAALKKSS